MVLDKGKNIAYGEPLGTLLNSSLEHVPDSADIDNIYDLPVREFKVSENLVVLDFFGTSLNIAYYAHQIRPSIRIGIKARDIIVANAVVSGISARNIIKAELIKIAHFGKKVVLHTSVHDKDCLVEITAGALDELKLKAGDIIYLIIKARSIVVLE